MDIATIVLFIVYTLGIGTLVTFFCKNSTEFFERIIMSIGIGLGTIPILLCIINAFHIPITYSIFLTLGVMGLVIGLSTIKQYKRVSLFAFIILILFSIHLFMMVKGEMSVPYLHDTDPYGHVGGVKYIAEQKTLFDKTDWSSFDFPKDMTTYVDYYPPGYDGILAILYQTSDQMMWTLKFFNALIISLGILFFYFAMKRFTGKKWIALSSAFVLAFIPSYLSHFIWSHALVPTLFFVALYCLERIRKDWKWIIPSMLVIASIGVASPTSTFKAFVLLGIYWFIKLIFKDKSWKYILISIIVGGLLCALVWWIPIAIIHGGARNIADESLAIIKEDTSLVDSILTIFNPEEGSATREYTFNDFFGASEFNMINQPVGWGPFIFALLCAFFILFIIVLFVGKRKEIQSWVWITIFWFIFTFLGVNSMTFHLPIGLFAFRFWMFLAIPVSILTGYTIYLIADIVKFKDNKKITKIFMAGIIIVMLMFVGITSGIPKYKLNTMPWGTAFGYTTENEMQGLLQTMYLPKDTRIISYSGCSTVFLSYDLECCQYCEDEIKFQTEVTNMYIPDLFFWLKNHNYQLLTVGVKDIRFHYTIGGNETLQRIIPIVQEFGNSKYFEVLYQNSDMAIFRVKTEVTN